MKIKKEILVTLSDHGGAEMIIRGIDCRDEYRATQFRRAIRKALDEIADAEVEFARQCKLKINESGNLEGPDSGLRKFREFRKELLKEEAEIDCKPISFKSWHALKIDNMALAVRAVEEALEGGFWLAPEDKDNKSSK